MGSLGWLARELGPLRGDVLVMGGAVLLLHGLREEIGDVDLFVRPATYRRLRLSGWDERRPNPHDDAFLVWHGGPVPVCAFIRSRLTTPQVDTQETWERSHVHQGWRCADLELIYEWKRHAASNGNAKHERDAQVIALHLGLAEFGEAFGPC